MAKKVFKEGFKPRNLFENHIPELVDKLKVATGEEMKAKIVSMIRNKHGQDVMNK